MTQENPSSESEAVRSAIQSQHPGIADEIEGAIRTLRKLKLIAGPGTSAAFALPADNGVPDGATIELTSARAGLSSAAPGAGGATIAATQAGPEFGRGVPIFNAGTSFGRYQIVKPLGRGAMGAVYLAYDSQLQRHFRDAHTATAHFQVNEASRELPGRILLGQPADVSTL